MNFIIKTAFINSRLEYAMYLVFEVVLNCTYELKCTNDVENDVIIIKKEGNTNQLIKLGIHDVLKQSGVLPQEIYVRNHLNLPFFFEIEGDNLDLPFDMFAMAFYLVTRYEEYNHISTDFLKRFEGKSSLAYKNNFLELPLIDLWAYKLKEIIEEKFQSPINVQNKYKFTPTIDVDVAWAFKNKKWWIAIGKTVKSILSFRIRFLIYQWRVLLNSQRDPYDTYTYLRELEEENKCKHHYFISIGDRGKFDQPIHYNNSNYVQLINNLNSTNNVGIHPSVLSSSKDKVLSKEIDRLSNIIQNKITTSRQHYLSLLFPNTYRSLIKQNIKEDYTLGYHDTIGFRASLAQPFYWYDLLSEKQTTLKIFPLQIMDVVLKERLGLSKGEIKQKVKSLIEITKSINGQFISISHNSSFSTLQDWTFYIEMYKWIFKTASKDSI